ncbi:hypothetical protein FKN04_13050 [Bacillus glycinifermentans]|uniref:hypothetical protein n=1 Tax=Bacillus TaxID=1386 RepID=UPI001581BB16|nr:MULTISPECIES: hypothetical protein [Bacillus]NUJ17504.1 hypothetical protein [Bacillus glycinifermentans]GIN67094.1 hypothetical protein J41TS2_25150 [Bacillus sonorensis]
MKVNYRGFKIETKREKSLGGWDNIYFTVMRKEDGWFLEDSFSESEDKIEDFVNGLKVLVDDYHENPSDYEN